jgi:type II restriction/modification system DNA methylase subunit YeeA
MNPVHILKSYFFKTNLIRPIIIIIIIIINIIIIIIAIGENIKMDHKAIRCKCVEWIQLAYDRDLWQFIVKTIMNLLVP